MTCDILDFLQFCKLFFFFLEICTEMFWLTTQFCLCCPNSRRKFALKKASETEKGSYNRKSRDQYDAELKVIQVLFYINLF